MSFNFRSLSAFVLLSFGLLSPAQSQTQDALTFFLRPSALVNLSKKLVEVKTFKFPYQIRQKEFEFFSEAEISIKSIEWDYEGTLIPLEASVELEGAKVIGTGTVYGQLAWHHIELPAFKTSIRIRPDLFLSERQNFIEIESLEDWNFKKIEIYSEKGDKLELDQLIDSPTVLASLRQMVKEKVEGLFSENIRKRVRGVIFAEALSKLMVDSPLWKEGPIFKKGGITLEMDGTPPNRRDMIFTSRPFKHNSIQFDSQGLSVSVFTEFITRSESEKLLQLKNAQQLDIDQILTSLRTHFNQSQNWQDETFTRPRIPQVEADASLIVPTSLINTALRTVYREGLLRFMTRIHLGEQTKGVIQNESPEVYTVVGISPLTAPSITFETQQARLNISDYSLHLSTFIEDRLIPSAEILTTSSIESELHLSQEGDTPTINLRLQPESFRLLIQDLSGRLKPSGQNMLRRLAESVWKDFLSRYSDLVLFPSVIETKQTTLNIGNVEVRDGLVYLHFNFDWSELSL